jgi:hypothetical protein
MIYIEKDDKVLLPKKYHFTHNTCVIAYDLIGEIIKSPTYKELTVTSIQLEKGDEKVVDRLDKDIHVLDWLKSTDKKDQISTVLGKHLLCSIVADFCSFMYESLNCAKKGKMSVAYALLRKPLTDELLLLEQLLVNRNELIDRFYHSGEPKQYDPSHKSVGGEKVKQIINESINLLDGITPFDFDLIYKLRYDKTIPGGLNGMMNHAHHIVTTDPNYKTERQNLNFIFSGEDDYKRYWEHYYYLVPYLLIYTSAIVDRIAFSFLKTKEELRAVKELRRYIAYIFWSNETQLEDSKLTNKLLKAIGEAIAIKCNKCKFENNFEKADFKLFLLTEELLCSKCFNQLLTTEKSVKRIKEVFTNRT